MRTIGVVAYLSVMLLVALSCTTTDDVGTLGDLDPGGGTGPTGDSGGAGDTGSGSGAQKLDVQEGTGGGGDEMEGCQRADFLFVIDNSGSMRDEQQNLIGSFDGFIGTIRGETMAKDFHIMVVDTDASGGGSSSFTCTNGECTCSPVPACCDNVCGGGGNDSCNGFPCDMLPGGDCDKTLGAGKVFREDGAECLPLDGPRFMTDTEPDLPQAFACVAEVGTYGDGNEQPMGAMVAAIGASMVDAGGCNEAFLRDDAILVVTFITDEEDADKSPGDPQAWKNALVAAKGGNDEAIVVLGLFGDNDEPGGVCEPPVDDMGAEPGPTLRQFVELFGTERGVIGSVCAGDYTPFFQDAVDVIDIACDEFVPAG